MWVSRRESRHRAMVWKWWLTTVDGLKMREEASKAGECNPAHHGRWIPRKNRTRVLEISNSVGGVIEGPRTPP